MPRLHRLIPLAAAVLLSLPAAIVGSRTAAAISCGILPYTEAALSRRSQTTDSREFVDVVGSTIRFRTRETTCIVVQFSAQIRAAGDGSVMPIRAVRNDGKEDVVNVKGPAQFVVGPLSDARSYGLLLPAVPPGVHTVRLQYRAAGDGSVTIQRFSMDVRHGR
jgi:hypothetical protein